MLCCSFTLALFSFVGNEHNDDPSHFFPKVKAVIIQVQRRANFLHGFTSGLSEREARKLSGARREKRQTSARSANARATPGWPASGEVLQERCLWLFVHVDYPVIFLGLF